MLIKNISTESIHLGFIRHGVTLDANSVYDAPDETVQLKSFKDLENAGVLEIVSFDPDYTRFALREEVNPPGTFPFGVSIQEDIAFSFNTSSVNLKTLTQGKRLKEVIINVLTAFSPGATLSVGFFGDQNAIFPSTLVNPQVVNTYSIEPNRVAPVDELVTLFIGGSPIVGTGIVYIDEIT